MAVGKVLVLGAVGDTRTDGQKEDDGNREGFLRKLTGFGTGGDLEAAIKNPAFWYHASVGPISDPFGPIMGICNTAIGVGEDLGKLTDENLPIEERAAAGGQAGGGLGNLVLQAVPFLGIGEAAEGGGAAARMSAAEAESIASRIANGHSFEKHVLRQAEFPMVSTPAKFAQGIKSVLLSPETQIRALRNGRTGYSHEASGTVVLHNPAAADWGTFFRPTSGINYFLKLK